MNGDNQTDAVSSEPESSARPPSRVVALINPVLHCRATCAQLVNSGVNLAGDTKSTLALGMAVVWSGNVLLLVVLLLGYRKLSRN